MVVAGFVEKVGFGVTRFKAGDRVAANSTGVATNDPRFGSLQKYVIAPETLTMKVTYHLLQHFYYNLIRQITK